MIHAACDSLSNLDAREAGYTRVEVPLDLVSLVSTTTGKGGVGGTVSSTAAEQAPGEAGLEAENETGSAEEVLTFTFCLDGQASAAATASAVKKVRLWTYVPDDLQVATATEECVCATHPCTWPTIAERSISTRRALSLLLSCSDFSSSSSSSSFLFFALPCFPSFLRDNRHFYISSAVPF